MQGNKKRSGSQKEKLHPRNKHRERYDMNALVDAYPGLQSFVVENEYGNISINFFDPLAVKALNKALLKHQYGIDHWDIPPGYLCPPVPGRADYIHHLADLLADKLPFHDHKIRCLDIGVGANCIYPIIGVREYNWFFIGSDIDPVALRSAGKIVQRNPALTFKVELRLQKNPKAFFEGILQERERIDVSICNPPFYFSAEEAKAAGMQKLKNLKAETSLSNFGGKPQELWSDGGEERFVRNMIFESKRFSDQCFLFTSLVAKQAHLKRIYNALEKVEAAEVITIPMSHGNKSSRIVAWTFLDRKRQLEWR